MVSTTLGQLGVTTASSAAHHRNCDLDQLHISERAAGRYALTLETIVGDVGETHSTSS